MLMNLVNKVEFMLCLQLILILTKGVEKCFVKNSKFDMRPLLGGTDFVFSYLIHAFSWCVFQIYFMECLFHYACHLVLVILQNGWNCANPLITNLMLQESRHFLTCLHLSSTSLCDKASSWSSSSRHAWFRRFILSSYVWQQGYLSSYPYLKCCCWYEGSLGYHRSESSPTSGYIIIRIRLMGI